MQKQKKVPWKNYLLSNDPSKEIKCVLNYYLEVESNLIIVVNIYSLLDSLHHACLLNPKIIRSALRLHLVNVL